MEGGLYRSPLRTIDRRYAASGPSAIPPSRSAAGTPGRLHQAAVEKVDAPGAVTGPAAPDRARPVRAIRRAGQGGRRVGWGCGATAARCVEAAASMGVPPASFSCHSDRRAAMETRSRVHDSRKCAANRVVRRDVRAARRPMLRTTCRSSAAVGNAASRPIRSSSAFRDAAPAAACDGRCPRCGFLYHFCSQAVAARSPSCKFALNATQPSASVSLGLSTWLCPGRGPSCPSRSTTFPCRSARAGRRSSISR